MNQYFSSRTKHKDLTIRQLYSRLQSLYLFFREKDYFKENLEITKTKLPDSTKYEASLDLGFQPFPITKWSEEDITEDHIFDVIEFLHKNVSQPGEMTNFTTDTGWGYTDYGSYDLSTGQEEFRKKVNIFLSEYKSGYELSKNGLIFAKGTDGLQNILDAEIIPYDEINVDSKVKDAIIKWKNRHLSEVEKKEAIRELADVFEWLKKTKKLESVLDKKDEAALFEIANSFSIRHHNPEQKSNYDKAIWYSWIFHFYLATYHAAIRLLIKKEQETTSQKSL